MFNFINLILTPNDVTSSGIKLNVETAWSHPLCSRHVTIHYRTLWRERMPSQTSLSLTSKQAWYHKVVISPGVCCLCSGRQKRVWSSVNIAGQPFPLPLMSRCMFTVRIMCVHMMCACVCVCSCVLGGICVDLESILLTPSQINIDTESETQYLCWETWMGKYGIIPNHQD